MSSRCKKTKSFQWFFFLNHHQSSVINPLQNLHHLEIPICIWQHSKTQSFSKMDISKTAWINACLPHYSWIQGPQMILKRQDTSVVHQTLAVLKKIPLDIHKKISWYVQKFTMPVLKNHHWNTIRTRQFWVIKVGYGLPNQLGSYRNRPS